MRFSGKSFIIAKKGVTAQGKYARSKSGYYYYSLSGDYSLEQLADEIAQKPCVVVFDSGSNYVAVYAHSDKDTTKFEKKNTTERSIALSLAWQALSISEEHLVVLVGGAGVVEAPLKESPFQTKVEKKQEVFIGERAKTIKKLRTTARRNLYRGLAIVGFLSCFALGAKSMTYLKDGYFQDAIALESQTKNLEHKKSQLIALIAKERELQKNAQEYGFEKPKQQFATDFLQKKPKRIVVLNGNLEI